MRMPRKKTGDAASKIAARVLATDKPVHAHTSALTIAIQQCGLPLSPRAIDSFVDAVADALAPMVDDLKTLAASVLAQDETSIRNAVHDEMASKLEAHLTPRCTCGESKGFCPVHEGGSIN